jgi:hypothetical protein
MPTSEEAPMTTGIAVRVIALALITSAVVAPRQAAADKQKVEEIYGTGFRAASAVSSSETLSDCGDGDSTSNVILQTNTGTVVYTGILEGSGKIRTTILSNRCVPSQPHNTFRVLDIFESLTVAGRTGGAVVETIGFGRIPSTGININDDRVRILCGTGDLKGVHGEGTLTVSVGPGVDSRALQLWVHFGHNHDVGFDFLCDDLSGEFAED